MRSASATGVLATAHVARLRKYFDRGGFLVVDDFHGEREWRDFAEGVSRIYPGRQMVELEDDDAIFHVAYDLKERFQVSGLNIVYGQPYERGGYVPHWRALKDENGRVQIAAFFNQDLATHGSGPTCRNTRSAYRDSPGEWASTTSYTR